MSTQQRRQDQGLGKTASGGSGGSFASHDRAAAAPPPVTAQRTPEDYARLENQAKAAQQHFIKIQTQLEQQTTQVYDLQIAADVRQRFPDAAEFHIEEDPDGNRTWRFVGLSRADGSPIEVTDPDQEDHLDSLAIDHPKPMPFSERTHTSHTVNLDSALNAGPASLHRRYIDTEAEYDDRSFSRLWSNAQSRGDLIGNVRSRSDFEEDLRTHLSESVNEMNDGERETFFDDGNIDAWVNEAMERYESNRPDSDEDARAFQEAVQAANPHEH